MSRRISKFIRSQRTLNKSVVLYNISEVVISPFALLLPLLLKDLCLFLLAITAAGVVHHTADYIFLFSI